MTCRSDMFRKREEFAVSLRSKRKEEILKLKRRKNLECIGYHQVCDDYINLGLIEGKTDAMQTISKLFAKVNDIVQGKRA